MSEVKNVWQKILGWLGAVFSVLGLLSLVSRGNRINNNSERIKSTGDSIDTGRQLAETSRKQNNAIADTVRSAGQDIESARKSVTDSLELIDKIKKRNGVE